MPARSLRPILALLAAASLLGACGGEDDAPSARRDAVTGTPAKPRDAEPAPAGASTRPVVVPATNRRTALLTAVRVARHAGYDRVVFEFRGALPGYDVRYVARPVRQDGSGRVVRVEGDFVTSIRMENALDADLSQESAPPTYTGPAHLAPGLPAVVALARTGGFEGVLTWVAGLRDRAGFRVATLESPPRLVVDFRHG